MPQAGTGLPRNIDRLYHIDAGQDCPVHVAAAILTVDTWGKRRVVSGRGLTAEEAEQRCLFEAAERHNAVYDEDREITLKSAHELAGEAINLRKLLQISETQYQARSRWNQSVEPDHRLPSPFDNQRRIAWITAQSLTAAEIKFVPAAVCFLGYPFALEEGFPVPDSSGLASGQSIADAINRGLLELVERDAVSIWWYNCLERPALLFDHGKLAHWQAFSEWVSRCERQFWLLDLTNDLSVPVAAAVSCNHDGSDLSLGFGAAATAEGAAEQALGELVQFEVTKKIFKPASASAYPHLVSWCRSASIRDLPFMRPSKEPGISRSSAPCTTATILAALQEAGIDAFIIDLSRLGETEKSVRVVAPGLRSIWPRYAPGRLYEVPFRLGWIPAPHQESELNPLPMLY